MAEIQMKPKMPKGTITDKVDGLPVQLALDLERFSSGSLIMSVTQVGINEDGKQIGSVSCCVSGGSFRIHIGEREWAVSALDLFNTVRQADDRYLAAKSCV